MPEQIATLTMHFPEVSGDTYQKFSSPKLGEMYQIDERQSQNPKIQIFVKNQSAISNNRDIFHFFKYCAGIN